MKTGIFGVIGFLCGVGLAIPVINHLSASGPRAEGQWEGLHPAGHWVYWYNDSQKRAEGEYKEGLQSKTGRRDAENRHQKRVVDRVVCQWANQRTGCIFR